MNHTGSPLRLVNVIEGDYVKLEETKGNSVVYAAISYCWGNSVVLQSTKTTTENLNSRMEPFPLRVLPLTLQEAVRITRSLRIEYLWIDTFCIVQDRAEGWRSEAQKMMQYRAEAYVTILPVMSNSAEKSMFTQSGRKCYERFTGP